MADCPPGPPFLYVDCAGANYLNAELPEDMMPGGYQVVCANEPGEEMVTVFWFQLRNGLLYFTG